VSRDAASTRSVTVAGPGRDLAVNQLHFWTTVAIVMAFVLVLGIAFIALLHATAL
jgi:hypothetical protein